MPSEITPPASGTATPTTTSLTKSQIAHAPANSNQPSDAPSLAPLDASSLRTTITTSPRSVPYPDDPAIINSNICSDHMITAQWTSTTGWEAPELRPYGPLSLMPTASVLHYATECFEGLKLYRGYDGKLRLFRVNKNCERMRRSAARIALPDFDPLELEKLIKKLCAVDGKKWLPKEHAGRFLYLRPTFIANDPTLGVQVPKQALLYVLLTVFPDMSKPTGPPPSVKAAPTQENGHKEEAAKGLRLLASKEDTIRAWPGGFGFAKLGANYGPSLLAQGEARQRGFNQILWLFGPEGYVTEAGASNFFVVMENASNQKLELITAPLEQKIILEGVTRASILQLARGRMGGELEVVERKFTMQEIKEAYEQGRLKEAFAAGTAFFVAEVEVIEWKGQELKLDVVGKEEKSVTGTIRGWMRDIMYGNVTHEWGVEIEEEGF